MRLSSLSRPGHTQISERARRGVRAMSWLLFWVMVILVLWDVALAMNGEPLDTWSEQTRLAAPRWPVLPWLIGAIIGHLFPPRVRPAFGPDDASGLMAALTLLMAAWSVAINSGLGALSSPVQFWVISI